MKKPTKKYLSTKKLYLFKKGKGKDFKRENKVNFTNNMKWNTKLGASRHINSNIKEKVYQLESEMKKYIK